MQTEAFGAELKRMGFCDFVGVPCSYLAPLINWAINENVFVMANNEGEAVAIASGVSLASINSSLGNHLGNPSTSLHCGAHSSAPHSQGELIIQSTTANTRIVESTNSSLQGEAEAIHKNPVDYHDSTHSVESRNDKMESTHSKDSPSLAEGVRGWVDSRKNAKNTSALGEVLSSDFKGCANTQAKIGQKSSLSEAGEASPLKSPTRHSPRKYGVVLMQNSGLSNALSPLTSLNHTFEIPILGFVSLRGEPNQAGQNTDEPQHELLGKITDKLLQTCQIECAFLDSTFEVACEQLAQAKKVLESNKSFFFIVRNSCFEKVALKNNPLDSSKICHTELSEVSQKAQRDSSPTAQNDKDNIPKDSAQPTRLEALQIIQTIGNDCALLATTGKCGRELYELSDKPNQLYMVGSMGCVSALGLGIALKSRKKVIAIDGDSALLMRLGTLSGNAYYAKLANKGNLCHILLDNQSHDSTGGQFNLSPFVDFVAIAKSCGYAVARATQNLDEFGELLRKFVSAKSGGAWFIYLQIAKGSKKDLGRPKITPKQVALRFGAWLNENLECADTQTIKASKR